MPCDLPKGRMTAAMVHWRFGRTILGAAMLALALMVAAPMRAEARGPESVADLAAELLDAVVNISTSQSVGGDKGIPMPQVPEGSPFKDFFDDFFDRQKRDGQQPRRRVQSLGSGFVIDPAGIIVTNNHVIAEADEIVANFSDGSKLTAEVVGRDTKTDLAVLRVKTGKPLKAVRLGDSRKLRVGDWVLAIGNPFGLGGSVSVGIVSAMNRNINSGPYDNFIQTDAAINRGNSGGPLFNMAGEVVGINTAIFSPTGGSVGIGFSVPSATAQAVIDQLLNFGETRRGWLGVRIQQVTDDLAESLGLKSAMGALVAGVNPDGPAAKAGIKPGDLITKFDGKNVAEMRDLPRLVADTPPDKQVDIVVVRNSEEVTLQVTIERLSEADEQKTADNEQDKDADKPQQSKVLGMELSSLTAELREKFKIDSKVEGVLVVDIDADSAAAEKGVVPGTVITEVAQQAVSSPADISERLKQLDSQGRRLAQLLLSDAKGELRFIALRIKDKEE